MPAKFKFYEVVEISSDRPALREVDGKRGAILGMAENDDGSWGYAVCIFDEEIGYDVSEEELLTTGEMMKREDFYDGENITIIVDPETGEGSLKQ